ncbi:MAG: hypothetical protein KGL39_08675 [Patescibacteria group bacterium]|nr:hypothetical protein [Patescibacteria group bacterium]
MGLGTNNTTKTNAAVFIPALWSDEVIASFKSNLVSTDLVTVMDHVGKKGDTVYIPSGTRGTPSAKAASTQVTLIANTETHNTYTIDQHWEYSRLIEDIVSVQAFDSLRQFYTDDAGYALAKKIDTFVQGEWGALQSGTAYSTALVGDGVTTWSGSANTNTGNSASLTDDGIRRLIQKLDDKDVPFRNRAFVVPPVEKRKLLGISRFTEQAFVGEGGQAGIRNGLIGDLYGVPVYVSTNTAQVLSADGVTVNYAGALIHKDSTVLIMQQNPRSQTQYKLEWLADLYTTDTIFGGGILRPEAGVVFMLPST